MIANLFKQKAELYGLPQEDLANAVSCLLYKKDGKDASAKEYRNMIVSSSSDLWIAAEEVVKEMKLVTHG